MCFVPRCYEASKLALKGVELVNPSQQRFEESWIKSIEIKMPDQTLKHKSMLPTTDLQPILKFQCAIFELTRRRFPCPEQTSNGVCGKSLMKEYWEEYADRVAFDGQNIDQMKHFKAYESMLLQYTNQQDQTTKKQLHTHETCSMDMPLGQLIAVRQAEREHLVKKNKKTLPNSTKWSRF